MNQPGEVIIGFLELLEAEATQLEEGTERFVDAQGHRIRTQALRLGIGAGLVLLALTLVLTACAMTFLGVYLDLSMRLTPILATFITAGVTLLTAAALLGAALWTNR